MRLLATSLAPVFVVLMLAPLAKATLAEALTLEELVQQSDVAALVVVRGQSTRWDERRRIVTDVLLEVVDTMKGEARTDFVLTTFGGAIGDLGMRIEGEPSFVDGERYVVFARRWNEHWRPVGMSQGVMLVQREDGRDVVLPGGGGLSLVTPRPDGSLARSVGPMVFRRPLGALVEQVRGLAQRSPR